MSRQQPGDPTTFGPYSQAYGYDQFGNMNVRFGWGGWDTGYVNWTPSYTNNRLATNPATQVAMQYDASGNLTNDTYQSYTYDATGQQAYASATALSQNYDGNGLRVKKTENGVTIYYLRSTALGGQVVAELDSSGNWSRGYVYLGGQMVAIQSGGVNWVHQDPITKSQRITNSSGTVISTIDVDPWGGETDKSSNQAFQPHRFTTYERDANAGDEAMMRRYTGKWHRFYQPDPYDGSYDMSDPQSFNRYSYVQSDPVNFVDPTGLDFCYGDTLLPSEASPNLPGFEDWRCGSTKSGGGGGGGDHGGGGGGAGGKAPQNTSAHFDDTTFNRCVNELFGVDPAPSNDGKRVGLAPISGGIGSYSGLSMLTWEKFTIYTNGLNKDSKQLAIEGGADPGKTALGYTDPRNPYLNWIASDYVKNSSVASVFNLANQIHETGNAIADINSKNFHGYQKPKPLNSKPFEGDTDSGAALEECVFGGPVLPNGTVQH